MTHENTEEQLGDQAAKAAAEARSALATAAFNMLANIVERLWLRIHSHLPSVRLVTMGGMGDLLCQIEKGGPRAALYVQPAKHEVVRAGSFPYSGWDAVAQAEICLFQKEPICKWFTSFWFAKPKGQADYRWIEVSFWATKGEQQRVEPFSMSPGRDADIALCDINCGIGIAFGPVAIDGENESEFQERWVWLLSKAAVGELRRPSQMPFTWPPSF
jgi:eukaryotic-like serine/threonine-protein kinase